MSLADLLEQRRLGPRTVRTRGRSEAGRGSRRSARSSRGGAPGIETTARRLPCRSGVAAKSRRVYGWLGSWKSASIGGRLDDLAGVHDRRAVADLGDDRQVVRDEDEREPEVVGERDEQLEDLRLHHHVERGRRLVGEEDLRLAGERHGDRRALPHPARELVREAVRPVRRDARRARAAPPPAGAPACPRRSPCSSIGSTICDADRLDRVEGVHRSLEDHRDVVPAVRADGLLPAREDVLAVEHAPRPATRRVRGQEAHDREHRRRLSAAGLADEAERSPASSSKLDPWTACSSPPPGSSNQTFRSSTARSGVAHSASELPAQGSEPEAAHGEVADAQARVERVLERLPDHACRRG